jgi:hypothetical protein
MRVLIVVALIVLLYCIFFVPIEGFQVMTREAAIAAIHPTTDKALANNLGSLMQLITPTLKIRPVEPNFTMTDPTLLAPLVKDDLRKEVKNEMLSLRSTSIVNVQGR